MTQQRPDFDTLSAYVDGELSPEGAAQVAAAAAADPRTAADIAKLQALRASVSRLAPEAVVVPILHSAPPTPSRGIRLPLSLAGAGALLLAVVAAEWNRPAGPEPTPKVQALVAAHDAWTAMSGPELGPAADTMDPYRSLLGRAGLSLAHSTTLFGAERNTGRHFGFIGPRGCKLSLFELPQGSIAEETVAISDDLATASWVARDADLFVTARAMNPDRFAAVVSALQKATREGEPAGADRIAALTHARQACRT